MNLHKSWPCRLGQWVLLISVLGGCGSGNDSLDSGDSKIHHETNDSLRSEVERGPVKFTVDFSPSKPRLSDEPQLTLTIRASKGIRVHKVPFGEALGDFLIRNFHEPLPESDGNSQIIRQVYTLEATRSGTLTIAPITVHFHDERPAGDGGQHAIESEAISIEISTVLAEDVPSLANLRPAVGPIEIPVTGISNSWWILGILILITLIAVFLLKRRRLYSVNGPLLSPQERAWLELEQFAAQDLSESDIKEFYVALTGIVRRYIERSTGVHAPEQTTEEFLYEIAGKDFFVDKEQQHLRDFLEAADLVKFAGYQPLATDIEQSFDRAKRFIGLQNNTSQEVAA